MFVCYAKIMVLLFLVCNVFIYGNEKSVVLDFFKLRNIHQDEKMQEKIIADVNGRFIQIRGFLYKKDQFWILSSEPDLKSCCVGIEGKRYEQIIVRKLIGSGFPANRPVVLEGVLRIDLKDVHPYHFEKAFIRVENYDMKDIVIKVTIAISIFFFLWFFLRTKNFFYIFYCSSKK